MNSLDGYQVVDSYWYDQVPSYWKKTKNKYVFCQDKHVVGEDWEKFTLLTMGKSGVKPRDMDGGGKFPANFETYQTVEPNRYPKFYPKLNKDRDNELPSSTFPFPFPESPPWQP